jgi:hypothetical protein
MLIALLLVAASLAGEEPTAVAGTWEGESKCTVAGSPCHDEHVVYEIKQQAEADRFAIDAYKIVSGERDFMGTIACHYQAKESALHCVGRRPDDIWTFTISRNSMSGTLVIGADRQLFRRVQVTRK